MHFLAIVAVISSITRDTLAVRTVISRNAANETVTAHANTNGTIYSFADSCTTYGVHQLDHDAWLGADCRAHDGSQPYSSLNLNLCIANSFGTMVARQDGNFAQTCNRMLIHGSRPILYAFCDTGSYPQETVIDLGDFIDNDNGRLHCFGRYAS